MRRLASAICILAFSAAPLFAAHDKPNAQFVPLPVLQARTIGVAVYWPDGTESAKREVQAEGEQFLRTWNRFLVVPVAAKPDLVALVTVSPVTQGPGFWRLLAYGIGAASAQLAASQQNYEHCQGEISGFGSGNQRTYDVDTSCYGYTQQSQPRSIPPPPQPSEVLSGSILLFDASFLKTNGPIPEPVLFAQAENRGREPLIGAAKRLKQEIDEAAKALPRRMDAVNAFAARIHVLAAGQNLTPAEEQACSMAVAHQIGTNPQMLTRLEQGKFDDTDRIFSTLCVKPAPQR